MSDCSVEPLNICLDKSQFHFSQDFKSDGRRKKSRYYMSAPCCCWVPFSSLEIKNVHSHKLERRLVLPFYSKDELHIAHEVWNVLIKQCKPLTFMSYYTVKKANSHPWELTLTLINVSTLAGGGGNTHNQWELMAYQTWGYREQCASVWARLWERNSIPPKSLFASVPRGSLLYEGSHALLSVPRGDDLKREGNELQQLLWLQTAFTNARSERQSWAVLILGEQSMGIFRLKENRVQNYRTYFNIE